jgi:hypothetical protein
MLADRAVLNRPRSTVLRSGLLGPTDAVGTRPQQRPTLSVVSVSGGATEKSRQASPGCCAGALARGRGPLLKLKETGTPDRSLFIEAKQTLL